MKKAFIKMKPWQPKVFFKDLVKMMVEALKDSV